MPFGLRFGARPSTERRGNSGGWRVNRRLPLRRDRGEESGQASPRLIQAIQSFQERSGLKVDVDPYSFL